MVRQGVAVIASLPTARRAGSPAVSQFATVEAVVEIPKGSRNKYEIDKVTGRLHLDRVLYSSVHYPTDYGYILDTHADDGDALDVLIVLDEPTFPGCQVTVRPIGVLLMRDEKGLDEKILAVAVADPLLGGLTELDHMRDHRLREIEHFFETYKLLEGKETHVEGWRDAAHAREILDRYWTGPR
jgi:inorganic pyrophosphatase